VSKYFATDFWDYETDCCSPLGATYVGGTPFQ